MGMDVVGKKPRAEVGKCFCASIWSWHPLWGYACSVAPDIISETVAQRCATNDGYGLGDKASRELAARLRQKLTTTGKPRQMPDYVQQVAALFGMDTESLTIDWATVERFANFLDHCGGFRVW